MLLLSEYQIDIVDKGDPSILVMHLEQRGRLWCEFEILEQQLAPHKGIPMENRTWEDTDERQLTEQSLKRCQELLEEIMANDQVSLKKAEELKDRVEKDLRRVQVGKTAVTGYSKMG